MIDKKNKKKTEKILSFLNCAAGGVLLGVSIVHVLPEAGEHINEAVNDFPLSFYITFFGLIIMVSLVKLGGHNHDHGIELPETAYTDPVED